VCRTPGKHPIQLFLKEEEEEEALQCYSLVGVYNLSASKDKIKEFVCQNPETKMFHRITILFATYTGRSVPKIQRNPQEKFSFYSGCYISDK
jgi:hypothetical protein